MVCTLAFRHGESVANEVTRLIFTNRHSEIPESFWRLSDREYPLTTEGRNEATQLSRLLSVQSRCWNTKPLVVSSPFVRAVETLTIALPPGIEWRVDERLAERDYGNIKELKRQNLWNRLREEQGRANKELDYQPCGGESFLAAYKRISECFEELQEEARMQNSSILILSAHGDVIRALRSHLYHGYADCAGYPFEVRNCHIDHFTRRDPDGHGSVMDLWHGIQRLTDGEIAWDRIK